MWRERRAKENQLKVKAAAASVLTHTHTQHTNTHTHNIPTRSHPTGSPARNNTRSMQTLIPQQFRLMPGRDFLKVCVNITTHADEWQHRCGEDNNRRSPRVYMFSFMSMPTRVCFLFILFTRMHTEENCNSVMEHFFTLTRRWT